MEKSEKKRRENKKGMIQAEWAMVVLVHRDTRRVLWSNDICPPLSTATDLSAVLNSFSSHLHFPLDTSKAGTPFSSNVCVVVCSNAMDDGSCNWTLYSQQCEVPCKPVCVFHTILAAEAPQETASGTTMDTTLHLLVGMICGTSPQVPSDVGHHPVGVHNNSLDIPIGIIDEGESLEEGQPLIHPCRLLLDAMARHASYAVRCSLSAAKVDYHQMDTPTPHVPSMFMVQRGAFCSEQLQGDEKNKEVLVGVLSSSCGSVSWSTFLMRFVPLILRVFSANGTFTLEAAREEY